MNYKVLIKYIKILTVTAVLFIGGLYFADRLVTPAGEIEQFYDEPKNSIDVLVVGGSHIMCSVSSTGIYDATGLTAYNLSTWSQPVWVSYHYILEALKYQSPKVVILDVFGSFYDRSYLTGVDVDLVSDDYAQLMKPSLNLVSLNLTRRRVQVTKKVWEEYLNITKYHSRITELEQSDWTKIFKDDSTTAKGYGPFWTKEDFTGYEYPEVDYSTDLYPYAEEYLLKIINLCNEKGIKLVFLKVPHIADANDISLVNTIHRIADENNVDFLDFCSSNVLELDFANDFSDHGHVSNYGAKKITKAVADYLNTLGISVQHTDEVTDRWINASRVENEDITRMEIKYAPSFDVLVSRAAAHGKTSLIIAKQDAGVLDDTDYEKMHTLFAESEFEMDIDSIKENNLFIYTGGRVIMGAEVYSWCESKGIEVDCSNTAKIVYNGENYSFERYGMNMAMYGDEKQDIYHYISFAKEHDYIPYTR